MDSSVCYCTQLKLLLTLTKKSDPWSTRFHDIIGAFIGFPSWLGGSPQSSSIDFSDFPSKKPTSFHGESPWGKCRKSPKKTLHGFFGGKSHLWMDWTWMILGVPLCYCRKSPYHHIISLYIFPMVSLDFPSNTARPRGLAAQDFLPTTVPTFIKSEEVPPTLLSRRCSHVPWAKTDRDCIQIYQWCISA